MADLAEMKEKNKAAHEEWVAKYKPKYKEKFKKYFDSEQQLDKFIKDMEKIVKYSEDTISLEKVHGLASKVYYPTYKQVINGDGTINLEKFNKFLDNIEYALEWTTANRSESDQEVNFDNFHGRKAFNEAFPANDAGHYGLYFLISHFLGNQKCNGVINLMVPDIEKVYKDNPKAQKEFIEKLQKYEKIAAKENDSQSLSNDMDKLFAGSSSELGKGSNSKSKTE